MGGLTEFLGYPNFFDPPELLLSDAYEDFYFMEFLLVSLIFDPSDAVLSFVLLYRAWTFPLSPREVLDPPNMFLLILGDPLFSDPTLTSIFDVL